MSLFFIIMSFYYLINRTQLLYDPVNLSFKFKDRKYKYKIFVFTDILYFISELIYYPWILILLFFNLHLSIFLILLVLLRWAFLDPQNVKTDTTHSIMRIMILSLSFIS